MKNKGILTTVVPALCASTARLFDQYLPYLPASTSNSFALATWTDPLLSTLIVSLFYSVLGTLHNHPAEIRTPDLFFRRETLCPAELQGVVGRPASKRATPRLGRPAPRRACDLYVLAPRRAGNLLRRAPRRARLLRLGRRSGGRRDNRNASHDCGDAENCE